MIAVYLNFSYKILNNFNDSISSKNIKYSSNEYYHFMTSTRMSHLMSYIFSLPLSVD